MGSAKNIVGTLTGGLIPGLAPDIKVPKAKRAQETQIDPNRGSQIAAARRKRLQQAAAAGRSAFRIDLSTGGGGTAPQTRSGITIG
ncbi:MAG: hypothetical protein ACRDHG_04595 [Anaerolineales bacterium]